jgi:hypothetical protein
VSCGSAKDLGRHDNDIGLQKQTHYRYLSRFLLCESRIPFLTNRNTGWDETSMASERERELRRRRKRRKEVLKERIRVARKTKKKKRA